MIHMSVLPEHMPLTDCLSYVYIVSKLGVLFQIQDTRYKIQESLFYVGYI